MSGDDLLVEALRALADGDTAHALDLAAQAEHDAPSTRLAPALTAYLSREPDASVYTNPAAFQAFITGGGNIRLYSAVVAMLAEYYRENDIGTVLDLGCGDGRAVLPAAASSTPVLDLVEPSMALREAAAARARELGLTATAHAATAQDFIAGLGPQTSPWDLAQASFALSSLPPADCEETLARLRPHARATLIVEFDVPDFASGSD